MGIVAVLVAILVPSRVSAQNDAEDNPFQQDRVDRAVEKAIRHLVSLQRDSGAIHDRNQHQTTMSSLAIMAMAAVGHQPADPTPEGRAMRNALDYVLNTDNQHRSGYFGHRDGSRMYGHGITTLMLGEMLGMGADDKQDQAIRDRLEAAIALTLASQQMPKGRHNRGGWRYTPDSRDSDLSVTVWQVMSLRSAKNAGIDVPTEAIDAAVQYIRNCYQRGRANRRARDGQRVSAFSYEVGGQPTYATAAAGLLSMQVCGQYEADEVKAASEWLLFEDLNYHDRWFFYGTYYYAQGMHQRGGDYAEAARERVQDLLLEHQSDNGGWRARGGHESQAGTVYSTALAVLSLSVKYHYLPIYQR